MLNFIDTYVPSALELSSSDVGDCRDRLESYIRVTYPELDLSPNTVLGDLIITPQAYTIAALEVGMERFMSDLDLANVADDVIYNCDFVEAYLKNFATDTSSNMASTGVVRLVFVSDEAVVLDRGTQFAAGDCIYSIHTPHTGDYTIYPVGSSVEDGENGTVLKDSGSDVYFADVPLVGQSGTTVTSAGTAMTLNVEVETLGSATALVDFTDWEETTTLPQLAERARETVYSASLNTRNGAVQFISAACPFVESVYATCNGDRELVREFRNTSGMASGCMDLYTRSTSYAFTETQVLKLTLSEDETCFTGQFDYVGQPYYIESVTNTDYSESSLSHTITMVDGTGDGVINAYSKNEVLDISVDNITDSKGDSVFTTAVDDDGSRYCYFTVQYRTDPMQPAIASVVENKDYKPVNTDIHVRGFIPIIIKQFEVVYVRKSGVVPTLTDAKESITSYLSSLGVPDTYSDAVIAGYMAEAGVKYMKGINVKAYVQWSVAHECKYGTTTTEIPRTPTITNSDALRLTYPSTAKDLTADDTMACSIRNIRYHVLDTAISFKEIKEV